MSGRFTGRVPICPPNRPIVNVRARVEALFGPKARVEVRRRETVGTIASIVLPATPSRSVQPVAS